MQLGNSELLLKRRSNEIEWSSIMYNCTFIVYIAAAGNNVHAMVVRLRLILFSKDVGAF